MAERGYLYVLINPSMGGLVKIGRTERDPEARAKELSAATGVPTPFMVAYESYFDDCVQAEAFVHTFLAARNVRVSANREFFQVAPKLAIDSILAAQQAFPSRQSLNEPPVDSLDVADAGTGEAWREVFELAEHARYGAGDSFVDLNAALRLYRQAARLGCVAAHLEIGRICLHEDRHKDLEAAVAALKEGARRGVDSCYAELGEAFLQLGEVVNAKIAWRHYFSSPDFSQGSAMRDSYTFRYLHSVRTRKLPLDERAALTPIRDDIVAYLEKSAFVVDLLFAKRTLFPENRIGRLGRVKWFDVANGYGFVTLDDGRDAFLHPDNMLSEGPVKEGQRVECDAVPMPPKDALCAFNVVLVGE